MPDPVFAHRLGATGALAHRPQREPAAERSGHAESARVRGRVDARRGAVGDKVELGIRLEPLVPLGHAHADSRVSGVVQVAEHLGAESFVYMDVDGHDFTVKASSDIDVATGQEYSVGIPAEACYLFDAKEQAFPRTAKYIRA